MKILQLLLWTILSITLSTLFSTQVSAQEISPLDNYLNYKPSDQNRKNLNFHLSLGGEYTFDGALGFSIENYVNTRAKQTTLAFLTEFTHERESGLFLNYDIGLNHSTKIDFEHKKYFKNDFFFGGKAGLHLSFGGLGNFAQTEVSLSTGVGRIFRVSELAMADRVITKLLEKGLISSRPSHENRHAFAESIGHLRNNRGLVNREKVNSEVESIIFSLEELGLIDQLTDVGLLTKIVQENYKYEFLQPRESGKTMSLNIHRENMIVGANRFDRYNWLQVNNFDSRLGFGMNLDNKKYINEKLQWNSSASLDMYINSYTGNNEISEDLFSAHAEVSSRLDFYPIARARFGYQLTVAYDYYEKEIDYFGRLPTQGLSARLEFDYQFQISRKTNITLSNYYEYSKTYGLVIGFGAKLRF